MPLKPYHMHTCLKHAQWDHSRCTLDRFMGLYSMAVALILESESLYAFRVQEEAYVRDLLMPAVSTVLARSVKVGVQFTALMQWLWSNLHEMMSEY